jgi:hypothetical protein
MFGFLKRWTMSAKGDLPTQPPPKVKSKPQALPSYATSAKMPQSPLPRTDRRLATTDTLTFRNGASTSKVIRDFSAASPELSSAIFSYLRVGITAGYTAVARNLDGTANPEATALLQQIINRFDVLPDYTLGFNGVASLQSCSESLAKELMFEGAMCGELVLDKTLLPAFIQPLSVSNMDMQPDKDNYLIPVQNVGGKRTILDAPTIFYIALDQSLLDAYPSSPVEASIQAILFSEQFINDIRRVVQRAIHPRLDVEIDEEKFRKNIPQEIEHDEEKLTAFQNQFISDLQSLINGLEPQDALVHFDTIGIELVNNGNASLADEYNFIKEVSQSRLASGAKIMPAVLGLGGTSNVASTESMLFVKNAAGAIRAKLNEFYSRVFTLAVRLMGQDVIVQFEYDQIDLRPDAELEAFRSVKQSRILELLSLGLITDEEASLKLTGRLPPAGMQKLSGTMFASTKANTDPGNDGSSNGGSALNKGQGAGSAGVKSQNQKVVPLKN